MVVVSLNLHILGQILYASPGFHWLLNSGRRLNAGFQNFICKMFVRKGYKYKYYLTLVSRG